MKTVVVLGAAYGGTRAAQILSSELPEGWRVILIDRNTHLNHLYVLPRYAVLPQHAPKAFIPYVNIFRGPGAPASSSSSDIGAREILLHARVTALYQHHVVLSMSTPCPELGLCGDGQTLQFEYAVYALGSDLPAPINLWGHVQDAEEDETILNARGTKAGGVEWLRRFNDVIKEAPSVLVVGGGALGIQYATDIAEVFPHKPVTLLHSRAQLMPRFEEGMHDEVLCSLGALNVTTILGERLDMSSLRQPPSTNGKGKKLRTVRTQSGREITAGVVLLCTGQTPNTSLMQKLLPECIVSDGPSRGMIRVKRTMQVAIPDPESLEPAEQVQSAAPVPTPEAEARDVEDESLGEEEVEAEEEEEISNDDTHLTVPFPHLFAIGDAADAYGAIKAGHTAYYQGEVAARNIVSLVRASLSETVSSSAAPALQRYKPGPPAIKISLGLSKSLYQINGQVGTKDDAPEDLDAGVMWKFCGVDSDDYSL